MSNNENYKSKLNISRRGVIAGTTAIGALIFGIGGIISKSASAKQSSVLKFPAVSPLGMKEDLRNPREIHSNSGRMQTELNMAVSDYDLPDGAARLRLYEGDMPGPTLRVSPGDEMEIALHNSMPENTDQNLPILNMPNQFNSTNLHFHGFHVSPKGNSDNVYLQINPGESFNYVVYLPEDHPAGNYWYHPHRHGSVAIQVASGCGGMMIVNGTLDTVPEVADAIERVLVFQAPVVNPDTHELSSYDTIWDLKSERNWLINGQYRPRIYMREGEVQHWRFLNAGDEQFLPMTLNGLEMYEIGFDGNPYDKARKTDKIEIAPGNRSNVMVKAPIVGVYNLLRPAFVQGKTKLPEVMMAEVVVLPAKTDRISPDVKMGTKIPLGALPKNSILEDIMEDEIVNHRKIILGIKEIKGMYRDIVFTLNGEPFDPARDDIIAKIGQAEEWEFVNTTPFPHPIHVHVNPMQIIAINGRELEYKHWQDTIAVPAAGTATVRMRFTEFDGRFVMHCHILPHEDIGMMLNVSIQA